MSLEIPVRKLLAFRLTEPQDAAWPLTRPIGTIRPAAGSPRFAAGVRPGREMLSTLEIHCTAAWPEAKAMQDRDYHLCPDHGSPCARSMTRIHGRVRRVLTLAGVLFHPANSVA
jgi:hypothetical protein